VELQVIEAIRWAALGVAMFLGAAGVQVPYHHQPVSPPAARASSADLAAAERLAALERQAEAQAAQSASRWATPAPAMSSSGTLRPTIAPHAAAAPAPAPAPAAASGGCASAACVPALIQQAFAPYGQTGIDWGLRVAKCESGYNPTAYNPVGPYYGVFQFLMSTFKATPYGGQNIYDASANVNAAAWKYGQGGASAWGCK
jgi:hypothetical protein